MFTAGQIVAHLVGDYVIQSDAMALRKGTSSRWAALHAVTYALPFLFLTRAPLALALIVGTHYAIDRWRLARYVVWAKNFVGSPWTMDQARAFLGWLRAPRAPMPEQVWSPYRSPARPEDPPPLRRSWRECMRTGYHDDRPAWLAVWLLIVADNTMHLACNAVAIWAWP